MDTLKLIAPEKANWECPCDSLSASVFSLIPSANATSSDVLDMESQLPKLYGQEAVEIPGARSLIGSLVTAGAPWAIVTSGTEPLVRGWISVISLPEPHALVTAESVQEGKPDPACFLKGREQLGLKDSAKNILVLEDSPAGIKAGKAAGCKVVGLVTSHTVEQVVAAGPDWVVKDLDSVKVLESKDGVTTLQFADTWTA